MRVIVTRPEPGATRTAEKLAERGFVPVVFPLTRVEPLDVPQLESADFAAVAVTSVNALRHAPEMLLHAVGHLTCYTVGTETAAAARETGFNSVIVGDGDATALAKCIAQSTDMARGKILYLCGRLRRPVFEHLLEARGVRVVALETYETLAVEHDEREILAVFETAERVSVLVYSNEAALGLLRMLKSDLLSSNKPNLLCLCISGRVASPLGAEGLATKIAAEPTEASLLTLLRDISSART